MGSEGCGELQKELTTFFNYKPRRVFNDTTSKFTAKPFHKIINWGNSNPPTIGIATGHIINSFDSVRLASNKLATFNQLKGKDGIRIPEYTTDRAVAQKWLTDGVVVVCRTVLRGHSGAGIVICSGEMDLPQAPLYVQYVKKKKEFRIHVAFGEVIDVQEKRKRSELPEGFDTNFQVRNHQTGWVYCREDIQQPDGLSAMAIRCVQELGLDFGAADIIYNEKRGELFVLECNTAPGLEGTTVKKYAEAFAKALK